MHVHTVDVIDRNVWWLDQAYGDTQIHKMTGVQVELTL